ncbi:exported hypothetical protein [Agrobacterium deltaense NCPPB 1641]|uniref:Uncharacterized protein n=1 Tax=Agrobacterium deltaense NCPPB 1641 TaxID=1183425 RepID=A0A1S7TR04_9HYPH|nr:exported hypothetical protein [Agrobacterium deltaense NCPPB 1641]
MVEAEKSGMTNASILRHSTAVVVLALGLLVGLGGWAAFAKLAGAVVATGRVVVEGNSKKSSIFPVASSVRSMLPKVTGSRPVRCCCG